MKTRKELKEKIKVAASYQKFLKNQRRTERLVGKREMDVTEATWKHRDNRLELREMYAAYAELRGRDISTIDSLKFLDSYWEDRFLKKVTELVKEYSMEEVTDEV